MVLLRLEKDKQQKSVNIRLRDRERRLTPTFLTAFAIACTMHLFGVVLFQVAPFKVAYATGPIPPAEVSVDFSSFQKMGVSAEVPIMDATEMFALKPPIHAPTLRKSIPLFESQVPLPSPAGNTTCSSVLGCVQASPIPLKLFCPKEPLHDSKVKMVFSENLSHRLYQTDVKRYESFPEETPLSRYFGRYQVKVEGRTGRIFWFQPTVPFERRRAQKVAENLLKRVRFVPSSRDGIVSGEVELQFSLRKREEPS